jgi:hypothetical protein
MNVVVASQRQTQNILRLLASSVRWCWPPFASQLANKRLLIVGDGALQYVPFAALPAPGSSSFEPLAVSNEIVSLPSASRLAVLRREVAKQGRP